MGGSGAYVHVSPKRAKRGFISSKGLALVGVAGGITLLLAAKLAADTFAPSAHAQAHADAHGRRLEAANVTATNSTGYVCQGVTLTDFDSNGGLAVHLIGILYTFLGIAIICDDYFVESLELISSRLKLSDDVAGATFMAAGSSAPELATAIVSTLIQPGDEGLGAIVGSAVFNIMIIVGITAICAGQVLEISPFPFGRDTAFYSVSILMLVAIIYDTFVEWWEALLLILGYVAYIGFMVKNEQIAQWFSSSRRTQPASDSPASAPAPGRGDVPPAAIPPSDVELGHTTDTSPLSVRAKLSFGDVVSTTTTVHRVARVWKEKALASRAAREEAARLLVSSGATAPEPAVLATAPSPGSEGGDQDGDEDGVLGKVLAVLSKPYHLLFRFTVPDCREEPYVAWYPLTFLMSVVWIGLLSYAMLWFSQKASCIIEVPKVLMGIVVISAGTSVPDALSSVSVAKNGQGDMAVSNVLGSNVFNIFLGLGLPWLIYTLWKGEAYTSEALRGDIVFPVLILFLYIALLLGALVASKWRLFPKVGWVLISLHFLFILWALLTNPIGDNSAVWALPTFPR